MTPSEQVLIVGALSQELSQVPGGCVTGVGKVNAAMGITRLIHTYVHTYGVNPALVLNLGSCGALTDAYDIGQVVSVKSTLEHDATSVEAVSQLVDIPYAKAVSIAPVAPADIPQVVCATGDSFVTGKAERHALVEVHSADVCDMELYAYARACAAFRIPVASLKVVSDAPGHSVVDWHDHLAGVAAFIGDIPWMDWLKPYLT